MKKILLVIAAIFIISLFFILYQFSGKPIHIQINTIDPAPTQKKPQLKTIRVEDKTYAYDFFRVSDASKISLIPNFTKRISSKNLNTENNCSLAINAGFYDKSYKPLGLFVADTIPYGTPISSALLNGFLLIDDQGHVAIQQNQNFTARIALQSGPLLILDGTPLPLKIKNDEFARRSVAAISKNGDILFFSLFLPDSEISGPLLQNLPNILMQINTDQKLGITDALNLDGGSASFFKGKELYVEELSIVGGIFCIK